MSHSPIDVQKCWWAYNVFIHRLLCKSHTRIVLSSLADIMYLPPGWKAMPRTQLSWPVNVIKHTPTLTSHIWMMNFTELNTILSSSRTSSPGSVQYLHEWFYPLSQMPKMDPDALPFCCLRQLLHWWTRMRNLVPRLYIRRCDRDLLIRPGAEHCGKVNFVLGGPDNFTHLAFLRINIPNSDRMVIWACCKHTAIRMHSYHSDPISVTGVCFDAVTRQWENYEN